MNTVVSAATVLFPCGFWIEASRFFSVSLMVLSQDNLLSKSLQVPRSATNGWFKNTTIRSGFLFVYLCQLTFVSHVGIL